MPQYPMPDMKWIIDSCLLDDLLAAKVSAFIDDVVSIEGRMYEEPRLETNESRQLYDAAFSVLLAYLYLSWFLVEKPLFALECLVTDFRESDAIWAGDGRLPEKIAGIAETGVETEAERIQRVDRFHSVCLRHIRALLMNGSLRGEGSLARLLWSDSAVT